MDNEKVLAEMEEIARRKAKWGKFINDLSADRIKINFHGHFRQNSELIGVSTLEHWTKKHMIDRITSSFDWMNYVYYNGSFDATKERPVIFNHFISERCGECGERTCFLYDGEVIHVVKMDDPTNLLNQCTQPGGIKSYQTTLEVPSGKIVFANNFQYLVPEADKDRDINQNLGIMQLSRDYSVAGVITGYVGNTCPAVYMDGDDVVVGHREEHAPTVKWLGYITTDLWWFCAMDHDKYYLLCKQRGISASEAAKRIRVTAPVKSGMYTITHLLSRGEPNYDTNPEGYARFSLTS